jgi:hypothetical protein
MGHIADAAFRTRPAGEGDKKIVGVNVHEATITAADPPGGPQVEVDQRAVPAARRGPGPTGGRRDLVRARGGGPHRRQPDRADVLAATRAEVRRWAICDVL